MDPSLNFSQERLLTSNVIEDCKLISNCSGWWGQGRNDVPQVRSYVHLLSRSLEGRSPRGGAVPAQMWAREGPPLICRRPLQQHWVWGLRVQELRDGHGDNQTRKAGFGRTQLRGLWGGQVGSPVHPLPHTCSWKDVVWHRSGRLGGWRGF